MSILTYTPNENKIVHKTSVDFTKRNKTDEINLVQYDSVIPIVEVKLYSHGVEYSIPNDSTLSGKVKWKDIEADILGCNEERNSIYFGISAAMTSEHGVINPIIELLETNSGIVRRLGSSPMIFRIHRNPITEGGY